MERLMVYVTGLIFSAFFVFIYNYFFNDLIVPIIIFTLIFILNIIVFEFRMKIKKRG